MNEQKTLHEKLLDIQQRLKVPKGQRNDFGGFDYRNIEDIEDRVKPLLKEHDLTLHFDDKPVEVGGRVYIESTAFLSDGENVRSATAYAREAVSPKAKTDDAQLTGACSSYARKYAASGLFLIDNTKDADSYKPEPAKESTGYPQPKSYTPPKKTEDLPGPSENQKERIRELGKKAGIDPELVEARIDQLETPKDALQAIATLTGKVKEQEG